MKARLVLACLALALSAAGCSSGGDGDKKAPVDTRPAVEPTSLTAPSKGTRTLTMDATVLPEGDTLRGAGIDGRGRKHFLAQTGEASSPLLGPRVKYDRAHAPDRTPAPQDRSVLDFWEQGDIQDYSYYELGRWERFCDGGRNMDSLDWRFVKTSGRKFPRQLRATCNPPSRATLAKHRIYP